MRETVADSVSNHFYFHSVATRFTIDASEAGSDPMFQVYLKILAFTQSMSILITTLLPQCFECNAVTFF